MDNFLLLIPKESPLLHKTIFLLLLFLPFSMWLQIIQLFLFNLYLFCPYLQDIHLKIWPFKSCLSLFNILYRVTQNKLHHLLAIFYFIFEVNSPKVSYVIQCILVNEVQFHEVQFWKCLLEGNISNNAVIWQTTRLEISFKIFQFKCFLISKKCQSSFYVWKLL